jgi:hypothetical protein
MRVEDRLPFRIFPGIFSSIDSYGKRLVHGWFDRHGGPPPWLIGLGSIKGYRNPPHFSKFYVVDPETSVLLRGTPDGILVLTDDSNLIIDYKTARFTRQQDELYPMYEAQLNAYAHIGERCGLSPISSLALVYTEPATGLEAVEDDHSVTTDGFLMSFSARILPVPLKPDLVTELLRKAKGISELNHPPMGLEGCKDCSRLDGLLSVARPSP